MKRKLKIFYLHGFFREFVLLYPVYMLMFESKGLSMLEISSLLMIWSVPVFLLEIPSGILADVWSRKNMIVLGTVLKLIGFILWLFAQDFMLFAAGFIFWGLQEAFCSGSSEALLFDMLKEHEMDHEYERYAGRFRFFCGVSAALSMALGGFVAAVGFDVAALLSVASIGLSVIFALLLKDARKAECDAITWRYYFGQIKTGIKFSKNNAKLTVLIAFCTLIAVVPGVLEEYDQVYAQRVGLSLGWIGVWGAIRTGLESLGSWFAHKVKRLFATVNGLLVLAVLADLLLFISVYINAIYMLPVYGLFYMLASCGIVLAEGRIQRLTDSSQRATVLSVNSLLINLSGFVLLLGFGGISEQWDIRTAFLAMAVFTVVMVLPLAIAHKAVEKQEKNEHHAA